MLEQYSLGIIDSQRQDIEERKKYTSKIFWMCVGWLSVVLTYLFLSGVGYLQFSNSVLITLISATTTSILSILIIVVNYLFKTKDTQQ